MFSLNIGGQFGVLDSRVGKNTRVFEIVSVQQRRSMEQTECPTQNGQHTKPVHIIQNNSRQQKQNPHDDSLETRSSINHFDSYQKD